MTATATHPVLGVAPAGAASPPAPTPPACAAPHSATAPGAAVALPDFLAALGLELVQGGEDLEVYGFAPSGADGAPDMSRVVLFTQE